MYRLLSCDLNTAWDGISEDEGQMEVRGLKAARGDGLRMGSMLFVGCGPLPVWLDSCERPPAWAPLVGSNVPCQQVTEPNAIVSVNTAEVPLSNRHKKP